MKSKKPLLNLRDTTNIKRKLPERVKDVRSKEEENAMIQKSIEMTTKVNKREVVDTDELKMKSTLFFRMHVSGIIESANVFKDFDFSFLMGMLFIVNMI